MLRFDLLCFGIEDAVLSRSLTAECLDGFCGILLPEPHSPIRSGALYVGTGEQISDLLLGVDPEQAVSAFTAGPLPEGVVPPANCNVVATTLTLYALHNRLSENIARYERWERALCAVPPGVDYPLRLLQSAAGLTGDSFFLFDQCFNIIASGQSGDVMKSLTEPDAPQRLSPAQINKLFGRLLAGGAPTGTSDVHQMTYRTYPVCDRGEALGYLFVVEYAIGGPVESFVQVLMERIAPYLRSGVGACEVPGTDPFRMFIERLYVYYRRNPSRLMEDMAKLPLPAGPWVRFLLISFPAFRSLSTQLLRQVKELFPQCNVTVYDGKITVLLSFGESATVDEKACGLDALEELLQANDGFAILSNACIMEKGIRTEYIQCSQVLDLIPKLRLPNEKRCSRLNRYLSYYTIHVCASHLMEEFGHDRLVYFAYPEILKLTRYDVENDTDLRDLLFYYVMNDCNVTATAAFLHMHRNTVLYKLNKIKELVGLNLDTGFEKAGILHSCQMLRYMERVQNQQASLLESAVEYTPKH